MVTLKGSSLVRSLKFPEDSRPLAELQDSCSFVCEVNSGRYYWILEKSSGFVVNTGCLFIYMYVCHMSEIYIRLSSLKTHVHRLWIASTDRKGRMHLEVIPDPLEPEETVLGVPGIQETEALYCCLQVTAHPGSVSPSRQEPCVPQSGPTEEIEMNSPEEWCTRCPYQRAGPTYLTKWYRMSVVMVSQVTYLDSSNSKLAWHRKLFHQLPLWNPAYELMLLPPDFMELMLPLKVLHKGSIWWLWWLLMYYHTSAIVYSPIY